MFDLYTSAQGYLKKKKQQKTNLDILKIVI